MELRDPTASYRRKMHLTLQKACRSVIIRACSTEVRIPRGTRYITTLDITNIGASENVAVIMELIQSIKKGAKRRGGTMSGGGDSSLG